MSKLRSRIIFMALIVMAFTVSAVHAQNSTFEVVQVDSGPDDLYISDTGNKFTFTPWVQLKSKSYGLTAYFAFRGVDLPANATILNATLEFTAPPPTTFAPNATLDVTIYGLKTPDLTSWDPAPDLQSQPSTNTATIFDVTPLSFGAQINVTVTDQVKEIYDMYSWISGNDMGFRIRSVLDPSILSDRYQQSYEYDPNKSLKLYIEYVEENSTITYYKGYSIQSGPTCEIQNFTSYTEIDDGDKFTVENSSFVNFTFADYKSVEQHKLYKDMPLGIQDFDFNISMYVTQMQGSSSVNIRGALMVFSDNQSIADPEILDNSGDFMGIKILGDPNPLKWELEFRIRSGDEIQHNTNTTGFLDVDTWYYLTIERQGPQLWCRAYTDEARTVLAGISYVVLNNPVTFGAPGETFYAFSNWGQGFGPVFTGLYLKDFNLCYDTGEFIVRDPNGTLVNSTCIDLAVTIEDVKACIDTIVGQTPDDPNPPGENWPDDGFGVLTRFNFRFVLFGVGWFLIIVPLMIMAVKSWPLKIYLIFLLCMALGFALQWTIGSI